MPFKCTMFFTVATGSTEDDPSAVRVAGWSESWYDTSIIQENVITDFRKLCAKRAALLPASGTIVAQRYQEVDPVGPSKVDTARFPGGSLLCDYPSLSLYCRVRGSGVRNIRPMYLRGLPDVTITRGEFTPSFTYAATLQRFFTELQGFSFRAQALGNQTVAVLTILATGEVHAAAPGLTGVAAGSKVSITGCRTEGGKVISGTFIVSAAASPTIFTLANYPATVTTGGNVRLFGNIYPEVPADGVTVSRVVTKKVGRPFGLFRGRQSPRA